MSNEHLPIRTPAARKCKSLSPRPVFVIATGRVQSRNSSRSRLVWARLTGTSVCFLSSIRNW
jgi:hypothetical protein